MYEHQYLLLQKGFVEAKLDDGLLEIFGFKQGWHASLVMVDLCSAKHIAQVIQTYFPSTNKPFPLLTQGTNFRTYEL